MWYVSIIYSLWIIGEAYLEDSKFQKFSMQNKLQSSNNAFAGKLSILLLGRNSAKSIRKSTKVKLRKENLKNNLTSNHFYIALHYRKFQSLTKIWSNKAAVKLCSAAGKTFHSQEHFREWRNNVSITQFNQNHVILTPTLSELKIENNTTFKISS